MYKIDNSFYIKNCIFKILEIHKGEICKQFWGLVNNQMF